MPGKDHSHFTSLSGLEGASADLGDLEKRFDNIMYALHATAANTFGLWDGAGKDEAVVNNDEFNEKFDEVQVVFRRLISSNDEVTEQMRGLHTRLDSQFKYR